MTSSKFILIVLLLICVRGIAEIGTPIADIQSKSLSKKDLADLSEELGIKRGQLLNAGRLDKALKQQYEKGKFGDIRIFISNSSQGRTVVLLEGARLRKVGLLDLSQVDPDIEEEIGISKLIKTGEKVNVAQLKGVAERIRQSLEDKGFSNSKVEVQIDNASDEQTSNVGFVISKGAELRIEKIELRGMSNDLADTLKNRMTLRQGRSVDKKSIQEEAQRLTSFLVTNQYPFAQVKWSVEKNPEKDNSVTVVFVVEEGQQFRFLISGNEVFEKNEIRSLITFDLLSQSDVSIRLKKMIEEKYRAVGYHFVEVEVNLSPMGQDKTVNVVVQISEGKKVLIDSIVFDGFWSSELGDPTKFYIENAVGVLRRRVFWEGGLEESTQRFIRALRERGYLSATVTGPRIIFSEDKKGVQLFFDLRLGNLFQVEEISFQGNTRIPSNDLEAVLPFKKQDSVNREVVVGATNQIKAKYLSQGFLDVKVNVDELAGEVQPGKKSEGMGLKFKIEEGKQYHFGKITVEGQVRTQEKVIRRELVIKTGEPYDPEKVRQSEENLALLGLFNRVELIPSSTLDDPQTKNILVLVREIKPGFGEVGLGALYEDPLFRARSFLGVGYRNLFGLNQTASLRSEVSLPISRTYKLIPFVEYAAIVGYQAPYPLDLPVMFRVQGGFDSFQIASSSDGRESDLQTKARVEERLEKKLSSKLFLQYRLHRLERTRTESLQRQESGEAVITQDVIDLIGSTGPLLTLDLRNDLFNPTSGSLHSLDLEMAHPALLSNPGLSFWLALQRNSFYIPLTKSLLFSVYAGTGWARSLLDKALPEARLANELALGGQRTIRGYAPRLFRAPPGTREMAFYNLRSELTFPLVGELNGALFFDTGQIFPEMRPMHRNDGIGIGFRYRTPVGPIVLDLAHGLSPEAESIVRFTFTVGTI